MDVSFSQYTPFWLELLTYANAVNNEQRIRRWNCYLAHQLPKNFRFQIRNLGHTPLNQFEIGNRLQLRDEEKVQIDALAKKHGGHPRDIVRNSPTRYMDFSEQEFTDDISFNELFLINASFNKATFHARAHFSQTTFIGTAEFNQTHFSKECRFDHTSFENTVYFRKQPFTDLLFLMTPVSPFQHILTTLVSYLQKSLKQENSAGWDFATQPLREKQSLPMFIGIFRSTLKKHILKMTSAIDQVSSIS